MPTAVAVVLANLTGLIPEGAAEGEADQGVPQFIAVIDSCSTVASDTHTK
jgi:hypothetical protein